MEGHLLPDILDLLVDGPSHVAGLYASLTKHVRAVPVEDFTEAIRELDNRGFISLWFQEAGEPVPATPLNRNRALDRYEAELPAIALDSLDHDDVGLWCEITKRGRQHWQEAGYEGELDGLRWTLDEELAARALTICAETEHAAKRILHWWLDRHADRKPVTDILIKPMSSFQLRDGRMVHGGIELTCKIGGGGERPPRTHGAGPL